MNLYIRNMVCPRCITSVEQLLRQNGLRFSAIRLGEVSLLEVPQEGQLQQFAADLKQVGFELLDDQRRQLIEKIKGLLIQKVQGGEIDDHFSLSSFLSKQVHKDYSHISRLFSEVEGVTIEQFFILQKVEKAKEWLVYNEYSISEIAVHLGYSSVQHLSSQFKKLTGMTPTEFKKIGAALRRPLDNVKGG